jgi:ribose transport system ATP-binding protein
MAPKKQRLFTKHWVTERSSNPAKECAEPLCSAHFFVHTHRNEIAPMAGMALSMQAIMKGFPGVKALDGANLHIAAGEVHGLIGENGAGKSTIIKVLAGVFQPDAGTITVNGQTLAPATPAAVHAAGVRFIHQELHLVPHFTVTESVFMGQELGSRLALDKATMRAKAEAFLRDSLGVKLSGDQLIRDIGTAERKLVQIARALIDGKARIVVFDEPTAPLASEETKTVMRAIAGLKAQGIAILYVSHYLNEITAICDRVTVFRQGKDVAVFDDIDAAAGSKLVSAMVGRSLDTIFPQRKRRRGAPMLDIADLTDGRSFTSVSFTAHQGEILGIAGLIGSGREEVIDTIYGLRRASAGQITLNGRAATIATPVQAVRQGVVLVPRDRRHDGLVLPMTVAENVTLATLRENARFGLESRARTAASAQSQIAALDIRPPNPAAITRFLSGGNQQKVVLGRWLARKAQVFLLDEPTVGVDVGAKAEIYQLMDKLAQDGAAIVVSSSDPAELVGLCDRIIVMMRGKIIAELHSHDVTLDALVAITTGATSETGLPQHA